MADIKLVKQLRDMTGLGFMDCKAALDKANNDLDAAVDELRKSSGIKAAKKEGRSVNEGVVSVKMGNGKAAAITVLCETDFVAKSEPFVKSVDEMLTIVLEKGAVSSDLDPKSLVELEAIRQSLVQKAGENIQIGKTVLLEGEYFADYVHSNKKIGVLVSVSDAKPVARDIAMHIAAESPLAINIDDLDPTIVQREKEIVQAQAAQSGKPEQVQEKMVEGRMRKFFAEQTLLGQPFVKDQDITIGNLIAQHNITVNKFIRLEVTASE